jgi:hypothetical protein
VRRVKSCADGESWVWGCGGAGCWAWRVRRGKASARVRREVDIGGCERGDAQG